MVSPLLWHTGHTVTAWGGLWVEQTLWQDHAHGRRIAEALLCH